MLTFPNFSMFTVAEIWTNRGGSYYSAVLLHLSPTRYASFIRPRFFGCVRISVQRTLFLRFYCSKSSPREVILVSGREGLYAWAMSTRCYPNRRTAIELMAILKTMKKETFRNGKSAEESSSSWSKGGVELSPNVWFQIGVRRLERRSLKYFLA